MRHGGPYLLPLQQQGMEDNTDKIYIYRPEFAVPSPKRDRGRGGKQEQKWQTAKVKIK